MTCAVMFCYAAGVFGSGLVNISALAPTTGVTNVSPWSAFVPVLIFSFTVAVLFTYIIFRSYWHGLKLTLAVFIAVYGLMTVVFQIESLLFLRDQVAKQLLTRIFLSGLVTAGLFAPLAVLIMGRAKPQAGLFVFQPHLEMPLSEWLWKIAAIGCAYVVFYTVFGYFVAWKNPAVQAYYGGHDPGDLFSHIAGLWSRQPAFFLFQFGRGLLWILFALPIIRMHKGGKFEVGITIGLLLAVWTLQLLMPNPFMPAEVARIHLIETASSNFMFGLLAGFLLA